MSWEALLPREHANLQKTHSRSRILDRLLGWVQFEENALALTPSIITQCTDLLSLMRLNLGAPHLRTEHLERRKLTNYFSESLPPELVQPFPVTVKRLR